MYIGTANELKSIMLLKRNCIIHLLYNAYIFHSSLPSLSAHLTYKNWEFKEKRRQKKHVKKIDYNCENKNTGREMKKNFFQFFQSWLTIKICVFKLLLFSEMIP